MNCNWKAYLAVVAASGVAMDLFGAVFFVFTLCSFWMFVLWFVMFGCWFLF